jgi:GntR family histidine utilization transcriptional repressor
MNTPSFRNWQSVQDEVLRRINTREWKPGDLIPNEAELAVEFGCARATVNRALREIAETGILDRRRKAGTRVALNPATKATLNIPIIRQEIEEKGQKYNYSLLTRTVKTPPPNVSTSMQTPVRDKLLHLSALHTADDRPFAYEDRWINLNSVPSAKNTSFETVSANEWLLMNIPYTRGEISFSAKTPNAHEASILDCPVDSALFVTDRLTWNGHDTITKLQLVFALGYQLRTSF